MMHFCSLLLLLQTQTGALVIRAKMADPVVTQPMVSHVIVLVPDIRDRHVKKVNECDK